MGYEKGKFIRCGMEDHESAVGTGATNNDADHQYAETGNGVDEAYGDIFFEENGGERRAAL